eukprot:31265-Pelagococcus_subviridis.AAC.11
MIHVRVRVCHAVEPADLDVRASAKPGEERARDHLVFEELRSAVFQHVVDLHVAPSRSRSQKRGRAIDFGCQRDGRIGDHAADDGSGDDCRPRPGVLVHGSRPKRRRLTIREIERLPVPVSDRERRDREQHGDR